MLKQKEKEGVKKAPESSGSKQHLFRLDRVKLKKAEGWELVREVYDKRTHTTMALMEKK